MKLITQKMAAEMLGCSDRSIRNLIARGQITGYTVPGLRAVRVDRDEIMTKLKAIPTMKARHEFVHGVETRFGGNVQPAPAGATVVVDGLNVGGAQ